MKFAAIFPGQGSQSVGMLQQLAASYPVVCDTFAEASEILQLDLWQTVQQGPAEQLSMTQVTQPAMLAAGVATYRVWQQVGGAMPVAAAGHSLGEYSALVAAEALTFADAMRIVRKRARLMQEAVPPGQGSIRAVLGVSDADVTEVCRAASDSGVVEAVNFNGPGQTVIAGDLAAVERAESLLKQRGAKRVITLPMSVPAHSSLMAPAAEALAADLATVAVKPSIFPVVHNVDAEVAASTEALRRALQNQIPNPVQWVSCINALKQLGGAQLIEFGPGKVLTGLARRIDRDLAALAVEDITSLEKAILQCR